MRHELKVWPEYFKAVRDGEKTFEIRENDRGFQVGDIVRLNGYRPDTGEYTGHTLERRITYITDFAQRPGWVVFGLGKI